MNGSPHPMAFVEIEIKRPEALRAISRPRKLAMEVPVTKRPRKREGAYAAWRSMSKGPSDFVAAASRAAPERCAFRRRIAFV